MQAVVRQHLPKLVMFCTWLTRRATQEGTYDISHCEVVFGAVWVPEYRTVCPISTLLSYRALSFSCKHRIAGLARRVHKCYILFTVTLWAEPLTVHSLQAAITCSIHRMASLGVCVFGCMATITVSASWLHAFVLTNSL